MFYKKGYSFIEVIIILFIISSVILLIADVFLSLNKKELLESEAEKISVFLGEARSKTLSSENSSEYGVHFEQQKVSLFKGVNYDAFDVNNKDAILRNQVEIYEVSLNGGGTNLAFKRFSGETDKYGTVKIRIKNDPSKIRVISIEASGIINN